MTPERLSHASQAECDALTALCLRSKASWGYPAEWLDLWRAELTVRPGDLAARPTAVVRSENGFAGMVMLAPDGEEPELRKLFVDPAAQGRGLGRALLLWVLEAARDRGIDRLYFDADPGAAPFYARMGAEEVRIVVSGIIPGRSFPRMVLPTGLRK